MEQEKIDNLKKQFGTVYLAVSKVAGEEIEAVVKQPSIEDLDLMDTLIQQGKKFTAIRMIIESNFVAGDKRIYEDTTCILSVAPHLEALFAVELGKLTRL